jgi:hypothetical protein
MARANQLIPGFQYAITGGVFTGETVTIVDNTPFPDGTPDQRKITVAGPEGEFVILPRLIDPTPLGVGAPIATAIAGPAPVKKILPRVTPAPEPVKAESVVVVDQARVSRIVTNPIVDVMDPRLDHLRPSRTKVKAYINRMMENGQTDVEFLLTFTNAHYRERNDGYPANIMLKGDTQSGKTFLVEVLAVKWADALGLPKPMPIFTLSGSSGITDYDLFGQTTSYTDPETGVESLVWLPGMVDLAAQVGGILYLDEINAFGERVTSSLHPLADHRHHFVNRNKPVFKDGQFMPDTVVADLDLWIIGTYNEGYRGMGEMNEAFINRFRHLVWGYDDEVEKKLVTSAAVELLGKRLRVARDANQIRTPVGTAALQRLEDDVISFGVSLGLGVFLGMFKPAERAQVQAIVTDASIPLMLQEEARHRQARADAQV